MHLIFIDDSGQSDPPRDGLGTLLALGGVIVPDDQVAGFASDLASIRTDIRVPPGEELKWKPSRGSFLAQAGGEVVIDLRRRMLQSALDHKMRSVVAIVDRDAAYTSHTDAELGREMLKWVYERVSMCLSDRRDVGMVVADKPGGGSAREGKWLADTLSVTNDGTEYVEPGRIIMPILTAPSHHVPHLQLADLVVAASTAAVAGRRSGLDVADLLAKLAHRNRFGHAGGAGIVLYPNRLRNLLFWAFGETTLSRPAMMTGYTLPWREWPYSVADGLS